MRRQGQYADSSMNAPMHRMLHFSGRAESLTSEDEYLASKPEGQWQWERDGQMGTNLSSSHGYREGNDLSQPVFHGQRTESKVNSDKKVNVERRSQAREQDREHGYDDGSFPQTWEGLERKFFDDIMKLTKEHENAEDAENSRHRERLNEINVQYEEKLSSVRVRQAALRDDLLRREQQMRQQQLQHQAILGSYPQATTAATAAAAAAFGPAAAAATATAAAALGEAQGYGRGQFGSYRDRQHFGGGMGGGGGGSGSGGRGGGGGGGGGSGGRRGRGHQVGPGYSSNARYY